MNEVEIYNCNLSNFKDKLRAFRNREYKRKGYSKNIKNSKKDENTI